MGWFFSLSVECAQEREAQKISQHFCEIGRISLENVDFQFSPKVYCDALDQSGWWCFVFIHTQYDFFQEADGDSIMSSLGFSMYELLRKMDVVFRYALFGLEVDDFRTYPELQQSSEDEIVQFKGLVLAKPLYDQYFSNITEFVSFGSQYLWIPYKPCCLHTTDQCELSPQSDPP